jgi:hypothetical protein
MVKIPVSSYVTLCRFIQRYQCFGAACCLHLQGQQQAPPKCLYPYTNLHGVISWKRNFHHCSEYLISHTYRTWIDKYLSNGLGKSEPTKKWMNHIKFPVWQKMLHAEVSSGWGTDQTRLARKSMKVHWKVERNSKTQTWVITQQSVMTPCKIVYHT